MSVTPSTTDSWRMRSPFYSETHEEWAATVRRFMDREAAPNLDRWEAQCEVPREFHRRAGEVGLLGLGFPEEYGGVSQGIDIYHRQVQMDELCRLGSGGLVGGLALHTVALPPILDMGTQEMKSRIAAAVISGEKILALAITEPSGGSDVARLTTRAEKRSDRYVVNGSKLYISNGMRADYFLTAVRTGGAGAAGLSLLLIDGKAAGLARTKLDKMGFHCQDTAALYFDNVEVPRENLVGAEDGGFTRLAQGFNVERLMVAQQCCSFSRACLNEAVEWAKQRETFGKRLGQHQVIRVKLADMTRRIDATQAWVDLCAWRHQQSKARPADMAMLKVQATLMFESVARNAAQVLGGASVLRGGKTERLYREVRINAIAGGSEEILLDLAGRQLGYG